MHNSTVFLMMFITSSFTLVVLQTTSEADGPGSSVLSCNLCRFPYGRSSCSSFPIVLAEAHDCPGSMAGVVYLLDWDLRLVNPCTGFLETCEWGTDQKSILVMLYALDSISIFGDLNCISEDCLADDIFSFPCILQKWTPSTTFVSSTLYMTFQGFGSLGEKYDEE